jgi:hypothetical protein
MTISEKSVSVHFQNTSHVTASLTQHDLDIKPHIIVRIIPQKDPRNVPNTFCQTAQHQGDHVRPCLVADPEVELYDECNTEEASEERVGGERRLVAVDCSFDGTFWAHGFAPLGDTGAIWCAAHCDGELLRERIWSPVLCEYGDGEMRASLKYERYYCLLC